MKDDLPFLTDLENDFFLFLQKLQVGELDPKTINTAAQYLIARAKYHNEQRRLVYEQTDPNIRSAIATAEAIEVADSGGSTG